MKTVERFDNDGVVVEYHTDPEQPTLRDRFAMGDCGLSFYEFVTLYNQNTPEFEGFRKRHAGKMVLDCYCCFKYEYADAMLKARSKA